MIFSLLKYLGVISQDQDLGLCIHTLPTDLVVSLKFAPSTATAGVDDKVRLNLSAVVRLTQLTSLGLSQFDDVIPTGDVASLWQLTKLQQLQLDCTRCTGDCRGL
jgi:hypothetical protein